MNLRHFLETIDAVEGVRRIRATVDPLLEIASITDRCCKSPGLNLALLFESVQGSGFRVATNLFGSERRVCLGLGIKSLAELGSWFDGILGDLPGITAAERLSALTKSPTWLEALPVIEPSPPSSSIHEPDLTGLPVLKTAGLDGYPDHPGLFMTLPVIITGSTDGALNCGMYRAAAVSPKSLVVSWSKTSGAACHGAQWESRQLPMPVVIVLGAPPALTFSATLPLADGLDELTFAGLLQGAPLKLRQCGNGLPAPADAELVIEGYLHPGEVSGSGAFGNHTGFYTPGDKAPLIRVTAVTRKQDMILPATVVGRPPMEDCWLAAAAGRLYLSLLKIDVPEVVELYQPLSGIFHGGTIISLRAATDRGKEFITRIRTAPQFKSSRLLVIVDEDQDPADMDGVYWHVMNRAVWARDIVIDGPRLSIDATIKSCDSREKVEPDQAIQALVQSRWREYGFND